MCILFVKSTNPKFSYIIGKNPNSNMVIKAIRKGHAFGYYDKNDPNKYIIYFKDADNEISYREYPNQEFEYLNHLKYTSPIFVLNAINEFFHSNKGKINPDDKDGFENCFEVNLVHIQPSAHHIISKISPFFVDFKIDLVNKISNNYSIKIRTSKSITHLINFAIIYFGIISCVNENDLDFADGLIKKLINCINLLDAPYYIRYIFASRVLCTPKNFKLYKKVTGDQSY